MTVDGVVIILTGFEDMDENEVRRYVEHVQEKVVDPLITLDIRPSKEKPGQVELRYETRSVRFERIRRITGYLVGTIDRWNNAKKSEERERVKHDVGRNSS